MVYGISFGKHLGHRGSERQKNIQDFLADVKEIEFQGEITRKRKRRISQSIICGMSSCGIKRADDLLISYSLSGSDDEIIGSIYIGKARIQEFRQARNDGNFDELSYYESSGIAAKLEETAKIKSIVRVFVCGRSYMICVEIWRARMKTGCRARRAVS